MAEEATLCYRQQNCLKNKQVMCQFQAENGCIFKVSGRLSNRDWSEVMKLKALYCNNMYESMQ